MISFSETATAREFSLVGEKKKWDMVRGGKGSSKICVVVVTGPAAVMFTQPDM